MVATWSHIRPVMFHRTGQSLTHIDKFSGHESGAFLENFSKKKFLLSYDVTMDDNWYESRGINRWRVGAPRHDIKVNLVGYLF